MTEKKTPTATQMAEYRQWCKTAVLEADYKKISEFNEEYEVFTQVYVEGGKKGVKDAVGEVLIPALYDDVTYTFADSFRHMAVPVVRAGKLALAASDGKGTLLTDFEYDGIRFEEGYYYLFKDKKQGLAISGGNVVIPAEMDQVYVPWNELVVFEKDGKYGFAIIGSDFISEAVYEECEIDNDEYLQVRLEGVWGYIDENGQFTTDPDEKSLYTGV